MISSRLYLQSRGIIVRSPPLLTLRHTTASRFLSASSMAAKAIPVIVCGRREAIGEAVAAGLQPEYELVHFVKTPEAGVADLPLVLAGRVPTSTAPSSVGTGNVARGAAAVILGGGYGDEDYAVMRKAVDAAALKRRTVWLRNNLSVAMPPPGPEYGKAVVVRVKDLLARLGGEGRLDGEDGGAYWY